MLLHKESWSMAFVLIFIAGVSDGVDGYLARAYRWQSRLGTILDPLADKLLIVIIFIIMGYKGIIPQWLVILVIARDFIILAGAISYQWLTKNLEVSPLFSSKINTAFQIVFVMGLMLHLTVFPLASYILTTAQFAVAIIAVVSGVSYVKCWSGYYMNYLRQRQ